MKKVYVVKTFPTERISGIYTSLERLYNDGNLSDQYTKEELKARIETRLPVYFFGTSHIISSAPLNMYNEISWY